MIIFRAIPRGAGSREMPERFKLLNFASLRSNNNVAYSMKNALRISQSRFSVASFQFIASLFSPPFLHSPFYILLVARLFAMRVQSGLRINFKKLKRDIHFAFFAFAVFVFVHFAQGILYIF